MALEGQQLGRYGLLSMLGSGGMGEVYLAEDTHIRRQVAIKVIRAEVASYPNASAAQESARLFKREIRAIAMLDHPHILPLFDYGEEVRNGVELTYMVMPLRQEGSLSVWFKQHNEVTPLSLQVVAHFIRQASSALQYAHRHQVVHQDVKLANFLVRTDEEQPDLPDLQLADFGVAKLFTGTSSMSQTSRGTPAFMAPEQWSGTPTPATDQYALAIMAYQLITGDVPFHGRPEKIMYEHFHVEPTPPSKHRPQLPRDVDTVIVRALAKKPEERFASIAAFSRALQQALLDTPSQSSIQKPATPPPASARASAELPAMAHPPTGPISIPATGTHATAIPPPSTPPAQDDGNLRTTLAISTEEARTGTRRTLTLPGGRQVTIQLPPNTSNGYRLRLDGQGMRAPTGELGALIVTVNVKNPAEERPMTRAGKGAEMTYLSPSAQQRQSAGPASNEPPRIQQPANNGLRNKLPSQLGKLSRRQVVLLMSVLIILVGSVSYGIFYFKYDNLAQRNSLLQASISNRYDPSMQNLVLNDPLKDNTNGYFWGEGSDSRGSCAFTGADYQFTAFLNPYFSCTADLTFTDFSYEVQMSLLQGDQEGIVFRVDASTKSFYFFHVGTTGGYNLDVYQNGQIRNLANGALPQPLNTSTNTMAVVAKGSTLSLFVNGTKLQDVNDSTLAQGQVGVAAQSDGNPTTVAFQNAHVWT